MTKVLVLLMIAVFVFHPTRPEWVAGTFYRPAVTALYPMTRGG